jgi:F0F1-type ATP synthase delta subunit
LHNYSSFIVYIKLDQIVKDLSDKYKTTISIDTEIDEDLVGGVVIKEGDKVIDLSIKARVNELGRQRINAVIF